MAGVEIDARQAKEWLDAGKAVLVDVREPDEMPASTSPAHDWYP